MMRISLVFGLFGLAFAGHLVAQESPDIQFGWNDEGVAVRVEDRSANEVLLMISAATGIPIQVDPANTSRLHGLYRKRTLEELLLDLSPGMVIQYAFNERLKTHVIERVYSSSMADPEVKQAHLRNLVISKEQIEKGIIPPVDRPVRYSGIGAAIHPTSDGAGVFLQPLSGNAPAARAGIRLGDIVTAIDGVAVATFTNYVDVASAIRGPENTDVRLSVRYPDGRTADLKVRREVFNWQPPPP